MELLEKIVKDRYNKTIENCSNEELYYSLLEMVKKLAKEKKEIKGDRKLYYISAEFLIGKLLSNNLINLGVFDEVSSYLEKYGKKISEIEEVEPEPSLGNGGLGRLAACFLDSIATLGLPGDGIGLNYHFGLFKQVFKDNLQVEEKNPWIEKESWLDKKDISFEVEFDKFKVKSRLYDIDIIGYENGVNKLHLFDVESVDETIVKEGIKFDKNKIKKNLTLFLYPDDSDRAGHLLRIYQQYFMVSNGAQYILYNLKKDGHKVEELDKYVTIQINDTHPTLVIPELIRLLMKEGLHLDRAIDIVRNSCAYTNHTILAEALEKWPIEYLKEIVPQLIPIIEALNAVIREKYEDEKVQIIDEKDNVHMANIDIHFGYSVNGVAKLHTDILKTSELKEFYNIYPEKFNNKTNGITFRRWLLHCNKELTALIDELIGTGYKKDALELEKLGKYVDDINVLKRLDSIKKDNKAELKRFLKDTHEVFLFEYQI